MTAFHSSFHSSFYGSFHGSFHGSSHDLFYGLVAVHQKCIYTYSVHSLTLSHSLVYFSSHIITPKGAWVTNLQLQCTHAAYNTTLNDLIINGATGLHAFCLIPFNLSMFCDQYLHCRFVSLRLISSLQGFSPSGIQSVKDSAPQACSPLDMQYFKPALLMA